MSKLDVVAMPAGATFASSVLQKLLGRIEEAEFKPSRLVNGAHLQLHYYTLRAAVPNGQLSAKQLCVLALLCCKYGKGYFHITTRQSVRFD